MAKIWGIALIQRFFALRNGKVIPENEQEAFEFAQFNFLWDVTMFITKITPEQLAQKFHETYERLAPSHGYKTRKESAKPWSEVPENNKSLMIAVCAEIIKDLKK